MFCWIVLVGVLEMFCVWVVVVVERIVGALAVGSDVFVGRVCVVVVVVLFCYR